MIHNDNNCETFSGMLNRYHLLATNKKKSYSFFFEIVIIESFKETNSKKEVLKEMFAKNERWYKLTAKNRGF